MKFIYAILLPLLLLAAPASFAQSITVYEDDSTTALAGAHVFCRDITAKTEKIFFTNIDGKVSFSEMTADKSYELTIYQLGFQKVVTTMKGNENKVVYLSKVQTSINEVVVTAQFAPNNPEKAVHNIRIVDQKKIAAMGAVNLRDVMMNEPNVTVTQDNVLGSGFSLQGIPGQNVKILIDGVPVIGRVGDNIDPSQINMANVERIEIVQGPLSVSYGTDALAGTINIISKKNKSKKLNFSTEAYYESIGQYNLNASAGLGVKNHSFQLSGGRNYFDGWTNGDKQFSFNFNPVADTTRVQTWKPKEQYFATFNYGYKFRKLNFGYMFDYFKETIHNKGIPDTNATTIFAKDEYYRTTRINNGITVTGDLSSKFKLNGVAAYNYYRRNKNAYVKDLTDLEQNLSTDDGGQDTSVFTSFMSRTTISNINPNSKVNYEVGYDLRYDYSKGERIEGDNHSQNMGDYAVFSSIEWKPLSELVIRPGARLAYNSKYDAPIVPSINVRYGIRTSKNNNDMINLRASYAKGFRSPTLKELYFHFVDINHNIVGNDSLKAETSHNLDFSANYIHVKNDWTMKTEVYGFYNVIHNKIDLAATDSTGTSFAYFNLDLYKTTGVQFQQTVGYRHLKTTVGFSYIGRYNSIPEGENLPTFSFAPEARFNVFYEWFSQNMTFGLFYKYNGVIPSYRLINGQIVLVNNSAYSWADASVSRLFYKKKLNVTLGAKNLFNVKTINSSAASGAHSGANSTMSIGTGRGYFARVSYQL